MEYKTIDSFEKNTWYPADEVLPEKNEYVITWWHGSPVQAEITIPSDKRRKPYWSNVDGETAPIDGMVVTHFMILSNPD